MFPTKTDKARDELQGGRRTLSQRERALLLMADGRRSMTDFSPLFASRVEAEQTVHALVHRGYLEDAQAAARAAQAAAAAAQAAAMEEQAAAAAEQAAAAAEQATAMAVQAAAQAEAEPEAEPMQLAPSADTFDGKRSLATTRMFLFDICERMFVRRDPKFAGLMRDALREARDRNAMLTIAALMLTEIEKAAGAERAESLRERIDKLLPLEETVH